MQSPNGRMYHNNSAADERIEPNRGHQQRQSLHSLSQQQPQQQSQVLQKPHQISSPSLVKRSATVHGTTPSSRRRAEWMRNNTSQGSRSSGQTHESIVTMRQEIMESLQKSPTKLYDEDYDGRGQMKGSHRINSIASRGTIEYPLRSGTLHSGVSGHSRSHHTSVDYSNTSIYDPSSEAKVLGSYHDDIFDTVDTNQLHGLDRRSREEATHGHELHNSSLHVDNNGDPDEEDEEDDDKLNIPFNNHNSISSSITSNELKKSSLGDSIQPGNYGIQPAKRVLRRPASPEKQQTYEPRSTLGQHPRKKSRNSPPTGMPLPMEERHKNTARSTLTLEISKLKNGKKPPPRTATLLPRQTSNSHQAHQPPLEKTSKGLNQHEKLDDDLLEMDTPVKKRHEKQHHLEKPAEQSHNLSATNPNKRIISNSTTLVGMNTHNDELEHEEGDELHSRKHDHGYESMHKKDEVSLIESSTLLGHTMKLDSAEITRLKATHSTEIASLKAQLAGKDIELSEMKASMQASEQKAFDHERNMVEKLEHVAKELHSQYSRKHEAKVQALKKQHEAMLNSKVQELDARIKELEQVLEQERHEKDELVKTCDMYLEMEELRAREEEQRMASSSQYGNHRNTNR